MSIKEISDQVRAHYNWYQMLKTHLKAQKKAKDEYLPRRRRYKENPEKDLERSRKWQRANPEKYRESLKKSYRKNIEKHRERFKKWYEENIEYSKARSRKYTEKHPRAQTEIMTEYRRSHRMCGWSGCDQSKSLHVHHILPKFKYPEYLDGDYHGRIGNNFICYCVFHHYAYHYGRAKIRKEKAHKKLLSFLWKHVSDWAEENKIPINALETELDLIFI